MLLAVGLFADRAAFAVDVVRVPPDADAINLLPYVDTHQSAGDEIQISTAPGADGIVRRIAVKAKTEGSRPDWIVFALKNEGTEPLTRWVVAPPPASGRLRYHLARFGRDAFGEYYHQPRQQSGAPSFVRRRYFPNHA